MENGGDLFGFAVAPGGALEVSEEEGGGDHTTTSATYQDRCWSSGYSDVPNPMASMTLEQQNASLVTSPDMPTKDGATEPSFDLFLRPVVHHGKAEEHSANLLEFSPVSTPKNETVLTDAGLFGTAAMVVVEEVDFFAAFAGGEPPKPTRTGSHDGNLFDGATTSDNLLETVAPTERPVDLFADDAGVLQPPTVVVNTLPMVAPPTEPDPFAPITTVPSSLFQSSSNGGDGLDSLRLSNVLHQIDLPTWSAQISEPKRASPKVGVTMSGSGPVDTNAKNEVTSTSHINDSTVEADEKLPGQTPATSVMDPTRPTESTLDSMQAGQGTIRAENGDATYSPAASKSSQESLLTHHDPQSVEVLETGGDVPDTQDFPEEGMASPGLDVSVENVVPVPPEDGKMAAVAILADTTGTNKASSTATEPVPEDPPVEESKPGVESSLLVPAPPESEELVPKGSVDMPLQADSPVDDGGAETNGSREEHFSDNTKLLKNDEGVTTEANNGTNDQGSDSLASGVRSGALNDATVNPTESLKPQISSHDETISQTPNREPNSPTKVAMHSEPISRTMIAIPPPPGASSAAETFPKKSSAPLPESSHSSEGAAPLGPSDPVSAATQSDMEPTAEASSDVHIAANKSLLDRIEKLEKELQESLSEVSKLQKHQANYEKDATIQNSLLVELQSNLQTQMNKRAEAEDNVRRATAATKAMKDKLEKLSSESHDKVKQLEEKLADAAAGQSAMKTEVESARKQCDESTKKEAAMALRLNEIIKIEGENGNAVKYYEDQAEKLTNDLETTKSLLAVTTAERDQLSDDVAQWKAYAESRSKQLERSLAREKKLNNERKRKMKEFIDLKTEEVRVAKSDTMGLQTEIEQTNMTLKDLNQRYKQLHAQWVEAQTRNLELQRDITKMKTDTEKMSKVGGTLEAKLSRSAQESEDHKNKRLAAKNEVMAVLRQLEAERTLNHRLRERIKDIFTPKTLSQQQSIRDLVDNLEVILQKVAVKLGRPIPPPTRNEATMDAMADEGHESVPNSGDAAAAASETSMQRALNKLENETKRVTQYIQAAANTTGRLQSLLDAPSTRGCVDVFSSFLMAPHQEERSTPSGYR